MCGIVAACANGDDPAPSSTQNVTSNPEPTSSDHVDVGGTAPEYPEPVRFTDGEYIPPAASQEAREKFEAAVAAELGEERFNGSLNGFRLFSWDKAAADPELQQQECVAYEFPEVTTLTFGYLPAGTFARSPEYAGMCEDGSTAWITQEFGFGYGTFQISYELGEKALGHDAPASRIAEIDVGGHEGVLISPVIEEGNGQSIVVYEFAAGFAGVSAMNLPADELLKIAGGIHCGDCQ